MPRIHPRLEIKRIDCSDEVGRKHVCSLKINKHQRLASPEPQPKPQSPAAAPSVVARQPPTDASIGGSSAERRAPQAASDAPTAGSGTERRAPRPATERR